MATGSNLEAPKLIDLTDQLPIVGQLVARHDQNLQDIYKHLEPILDDIWRKGIACTLQFKKGGLIYEHTFGQTDRPNVTRTYSIFFASLLAPQGNFEGSQPPRESIHSLLVLPGTEKSFITQLCGAKSRVYTARKNEAEHVAAVAREAAKEAAAEDAAATAAGTALVLLAEDEATAKGPATAQAAKATKKRPASSRDGNYHPAKVCGMHEHGLSCHRTKYHKQRMHYAT